MELPNLERQALTAVSKRQDRPAIEKEQCSRRKVFRLTARAARSSNRELRRALTAFYRAQMNVLKGEYYEISESTRTKIAESNAAVITEFQERREALATKNVLAGKIARTDLGL